MSWTFQPFSIQRCRRAPHVAGPFSSKKTNFWVSGVKPRKPCRSWKLMLNEYLLAKIGFDTAENEPRQACCVSRSRQPWFGIVSFSAWRPRSLHGGHTWRRTWQACPPISRHKRHCTDRYGKVQEIPQTETTPFYPRSPSLRFPSSQVATNMGDELQHTIIVGFVCRMKYRLRCTVLAFFRQALPRLDKYLLFGICRLHLPQIVRYACAKIYSYWAVVNYREAPRTAMISFFKWLLGSMLTFRNSNTVATDQLGENVLRGRLRKVNK